MLFQDLAARNAVADCSGGFLSSDGGALLLQQVDAGLGVSRTLAACFKNERDPNRLELGAKFSDRYRKIQADLQQIEAAVLELGVRYLPTRANIAVVSSGSGAFEGLVEPENKNPRGGAEKTRKFGCFFPTRAPNNYAEHSNRDQTSFSCTRERSKTPQFLPSFSPVIYPG